MGPGKGKVVKARKNTPPVHKFHIITTENIKSIYISTSARNYSGLFPDPQPCFCPQIYSPSSTKVPWDQLPSALSPPCPSFGCPVHIPSNPSCPHSTHAHATTTTLHVPKPPMSAVFDHARLHRQLPKQSMLKRFPEFQNSIGHR